MKGLIFEICNNWMHLYDTKEEVFHPLAGLSFDYVELEVGERNTESIDKLIKFMSMFGAKTGHEFEFQYFELTDTVRLRYFNDRFRKVKAIIDLMTLEEFSTDVSDLLCEIEDPNALVCDDTLTLVTLDHWVRNAEPGRYYVGATFYTH